MLATNTHWDPFIFMVSRTSFTKKRLYFQSSLLSSFSFLKTLTFQAAAENEPFMRMKTVVQWYLSGFYKKPKGLKKPYNPILGETFRCYWEHGNGTKTFYLAEQVSHHPPISSFYATNRQDGFTISRTCLAKSKFYEEILWQVTHT